jgi:FkbM family methyltransferase
MKNSLINNTITSLLRKDWTLNETIAYFRNGVVRKLLIVVPVFWRGVYLRIKLNGRIKRLHKDKKKFPPGSKEFYYLDMFEKYLLSCKTKKNEYLKSFGGNSYIDIKGAKLPDISGDKEKAQVLSCIFEESFFVHTFLDDNYSREHIILIDKYMNEGPYGYTDGVFDVTVKSGDVVIDAGAWIGDFGAYAVAKGATAYAFEPTKELYEYLFQTAALNGENFHPVHKGLSDHEGEAEISLVKNWSGSNSLVLMKNSPLSETITLTSLDKFVEENNMQRVDFIKSDIEGSERNLLRGATNVLKTFAPKLAISTYHLPDDPEVLEQIIKEANPNYTVVHLRHKLFAMVDKQ